MKLQILTLVLAVAGFLVASFQYRKAQKWKRAEFVAAEIKDAFADPAVRTALSLLDWNDKFYDLRERADQLELRDVRVNDSDLMKALTPHDERLKGFSPTEERIRMIFDELLGRMQRFECFMETNLVKKKDVLPYWRYWLRILTTPSEAQKSSEVLASIWRYIDFYDYVDVRRFVNRLGYDTRGLGRNQK